MSTCNTVRFGLIGYGAWGQHHARVIAECPTAELAAIAEPSEAGRAEAQRRYPRAAVVADYRELVARPDIEAVAVVVPSHLHHEVGCAVLDAGKHLFLEKPMALSLAECDGLIGRAAPAAGRSASSTSSAFRLFGAR